MVDFKVLVLNRLPKFIGCNMVGTLVDMAVLWLFSHLVFSNYVGCVVISPIISFECAVFVNFVVSYYFTWKDRVGHESVDGFFKRYLAYNGSCTGGFIIKMGLLMLIHYLTKWDVVLCNLLALCGSGIFNFMMNEFVVFKKKKDVNYGTDYHG